MLNHKAQASEDEEDLYIGLHPKAAATLHHPKSYVNYLHAHYLENTTKSYLQIGK